MSRHSAILILKSYSTSYSYTPLPFFHGLFLEQTLLLATQMYTDTHQYATLVHEVAGYVNDHQEDEEDSNYNANNGSGRQTSSMTCTVWAWRACQQKIIKSVYDFGWKSSMFRNIENKQPYSNNPHQIYLCILYYQCFLK